METHLVTKLGWMKLKFRHSSRSWAIIQIALRGALVMWSLGGGGLPVGDPCPKHLSVANVTRLDAL